MSADGGREVLLTSERLVLRALVPGDLDELVALDADPRGVARRPELTRRGWVAVGYIGYRRVT